jgi:hypothetical protein
MEVHQLPGVMGEAEEGIAEVIYLRSPCIGAFVFCGTGSSLSVRGVSSFVVE